jgi:hypothetical protein
VRPRHLASFFLPLVLACSGACAGARTSGGELVVVESHQFT